MNISPAWVKRILFDFGSLDKRIRWLIHKSAEAGGWEGLGGVVQSESDRCRDKRGRGMGASRGTPVVVPGQPGWHGMLLRLLQSSHPEEIGGDCRSWSLPRLIGGASQLAWKEIGIASRPNPAIAL